MRVYRGQDIGDLQQLEEKCLAILQAGDIEQIYDILPHLSILRSRIFRPPVERLLRSEDRDKKQFAVIALGILGGEASVDPLARLARKIPNWQGPGIRSLERTLISALGDSASRAALEPLMGIFKYERPREKFALERRCAVVTALASLVQQGIDPAFAELLLMLEHRNSAIRCQAAKEMAFAFWHNPQGIPEKGLQALAGRLNDPEAAVREAARSSLEDLVSLGNSKASALLE